MDPENAAGEVKETLAKVHPCPIPTTQEHTCSILQHHWQDSCLQPKQPVLLLLYSSKSTHSLLT